MARKLLRCRDWSHNQFGIRMGFRASLFYTFYRRTDVSDNYRPIIFILGGPGSASVWMHVAYTGPRILKIDDEGFQSNLMVIKITLTLS